MAGHPLPVTVLVCGRRRRSGGGGRPRSVDLRGRRRRGPGVRGPVGVASDPAQPGPAGAARRGPSPRPRRHRGPGGRCPFRRGLDATGARDVAVARPDRPGTLALGVRGRCRRRDSHPRTGTAAGVLQSLSAGRGLAGGSPDGGCRPRDDPLRFGDRPDDRQRRQRPGPRPRSAGEPAQPLAGEPGW